MDNGKKGLSALIMFIKHPIIGVIIICLIIMLGFGCLIFLFGEEPPPSSGGDSSNISCTEGNIDRELFAKQFERGGVFKGKSDAFIDSAVKNKVDPAIMAAIAMAETTWGKSDAVKLKNNPGGLMGNGSGFIFDTLEAGIEAMASNLNRLYISQGLVTIQDIGSKYAPIGAKNDPTNLNANWVPNVTSLVNTFGGLTMNCTVVGDGEMAYPVKNHAIKSPFGMRFHPIDEVWKMHQGVDLSCPMGEPVNAALGGKVVVVVNGYGGGYGNHIILSHGDKFTLYAHLSKVSVSKNKVVNQGETVGLCGTSGKSSGTHLHFEVQMSLYGVRVDPAPFLQGKGK